MKDKFNYMGHHFILIGEFENDGWDYECDKCKLKVWMRVNKKIFALGGHEPHDIFNVFNNLDHKFNGGLNITCNDYIIKGIIE